LESNQITIYDPNQNPLSKIMSQKNNRKISVNFKEEKLSRDLNTDMKKSLQILKAEDLTNKKTRAEIDILGNIMREKVDTLTFKSCKMIQNQEYTDYKKRHMSKWGNIAFLIRRLEKLVSNMKSNFESYDIHSHTRHNMDIVYINGNQLADFARNELQQPSDGELLSCIKGRDQNYQQTQAAVKIQAWVRMIMVNKVYRKTKQLI